MSQQTETNQQIENTAQTENIKQSETSEQPKTFSAEKTVAFIVPLIRCDKDTKMVKGFNPNPNKFGEYCTRFFGSEVVPMRGTLFDPENKDHMEKVVQSLNDSIEKELKTKEIRVDEDCKILTTLNIWPKIQPKNRETFIYFLLEVEKEKCSEISKKLAEVYSKLSVEERQDKLKLPKNSHCVFINIDDLIKKLGKTPQELVDLVTKDRRSKHVNAHTDTVNSELEGILEVHEEASSMHLPKAFVEREVKDLEGIEKFVNSKRYKSEKE